MSKQPQSRLERLVQAWPLSNKPVFSVLRIQGLLSEDTESVTGLHYTNPLINKAFTARKLQAVGLVINSLGGSLAQAELLSNRIRSLAIEHQVRVYSFIEGAAVAAGYMVACAGDKIYSLNSSVIGVGDAASCVVSKANSRQHSNGQEFGQNSEIVESANLKQDLYSQLLEYIKLCRGATLSSADEQAQVCLGQQALGRGMIDGISDLYTFITSKFSQQIRIHEVMSKTSWLKQQLHK